MEKYTVKTISLKGDIANQKNQALKEILESDTNYFFLVEDNVKVLDKKVYQIFIDTSKATGIEALMWSRSSINKKLPFEDDPFIDYWHDFVASFTMYTRNAVEKCGFMDEKMPPNTWQDIEYAKRVGDNGLSTPFGLFASPKNIDQYLEITSNENYKNTKQLDEALTYWESKEGEEFPITIKKEAEEIKANAPITEMI